MFDAYEAWDVGRPWDFCATCKHTYDHFSNSVINMHRPSLFGGSADTHQKDFSAGIILSSRAKVKCAFPNDWQTGAAVNGGCPYRSTDGDVPEPAEGYVEGLAEAMRVQLTLQPNTYNEVLSCLLTSLHTPLQFCLHLFVTLT